MKLIVFNQKIKSGCIRHRNDVIEIIIRACELIISNNFSALSTIKDLSKKQYPFIIIGDTSRLFLFEEDKFFSVAFPFQINIEEKQVSFLNQPFTAGLLATVAKALDDFDGKKTIEKEPIENIVDKLWEAVQYNCLSEDDQYMISRLISYLLSYEIGYIRYDCDPDTFSKYDKKGKPKVHPKNHFDVNYASNATYKLGLSKEILINEFVDCLNPETDCWFLCKK